MKKIYLAVLTIAIISFMSMGCMTTSVWHEDKEYKPYHDIIHAFVMDQKEDKTAFLGDKYHYIFSKNEKFSFLLAHRNHESIKFDVLAGRYRIQNNSIDAQFPVYIDKSHANQTILKWFDQNKESNRSNRIWISLRGMRYVSDKKVNEQVQKLSQDLNLTIHEEYTKEKSTLSKTLKTPFAVAADGAIIVASAAGVAVMLVIGIPTVAVSNIVKSFKE